MLRNTSLFSAGHAEHHFLAARGLSRMCLFGKRDLEAATTTEQEDAVICSVVAVAVVVVSAMSFQARSGLEHVNA